MANFKTHLNVAALVSSVAALVVSVENLLFAPLLVLSGTIGGILPDLDSDNSTPVKILFLLFSIIVAIALFMIFFEEGMVQAILYAFTGLVTVNFVLKPIFLKMTTHRGIFHSIPMGVLCGIGVYYIFDTRLSYEESLYLGAFLTGGYLVHLALDEFYSVDFMGVKVKSSFSSALKLFDSKQIFLYIVMYIVIAILLVHTL